MKRHERKPRCAGRAWSPTKAGRSSGCALGELLACTRMNLIIDHQTKGFCSVESEVQEAERGRRASSKRGFPLAVSTVLYEIFARSTSQTTPSPNDYSNSLYRTTLVSLHPVVTRFDTPHAPNPFPPPPARYSRTTTTKVHHGQIHRPLRCTSRTPSYVGLHARGHRRAGVKVHCRIVGAVRQDRGDPQGTVHVRVGCAALSPEDGRDGQGSRTSHFPAIRLD